LEVATFIIDNATFLSSCQANEHQKAERVMTNRPNILWICTDQQRTDTLGCYGNEFVTTPNIDRLAAEGALFENCFTQSPICSPSRASFLTGRYPRATRLRQNGQILPPDEKVISKIMAQNGYNAGLVGKFHMAPGDPAIAKTTEPRIDDGFAEFNWAQAPTDQWGLNSDYTRFLTAKGMKFTTTPHPLSPWVKRGMPEDSTEAAWCATRAIEFIGRQSAGKPWFYLANIFAPHHPFDPPERFLEPYLARLADIPLPIAQDDDLSTKTEYQRIDADGAYGQIKGFLGGFGRNEMTENDHRMVKAAYWAMCDHVDQQVGRIIAALEASGQAENTIIIFMSDHGEMLGDHNIYLKGPYFYDAAIRVPLIIYYPKHIHHKRYQNLFEMVNLAPTLLDLAGLPPYDGMQGTSAAEWLRCGSVEPRNDTVYCEYYNAMPYHKDPTAQLTMVRTETHKLVVDHAYGDGELYDLILDPDEKRNLWSEEASLALKAQMLTLMTDKMAFTVDPLPARLSEW
jgi:arylsulfatase A-like enzyme